MLQKVAANQPFRPLAEDWNAFVDAAVAHRRRGVNTGAPETGTGGAKAGTILARNVSGADQEQFAVMRIADLAIAPIDSETEQRFRTAPPVFDLDSLAALDDATTEQRLVILQEPLADGQLGRVAVDGTSPVRLVVVDTTHRFAVPTADGNMQSADAGPCLILWHGGTLGLQWAVVRLGHAAPQPGYATVEYNGDGTYSIIVPASTPINYNNGSGPRADADGWDSVIVVNAPEGATKRLVSVSYNNTHVAPDLFAWYATDVPGGAVARAVATADSASMQAYTTVNDEGGALFVVELDSTGGWRFIASPRIPFNPRAGFMGSYWMYNRTGRFLYLFGIVNPFGNPQAIQVTLPDNSTGLVYAGRQNYDSFSLALTLDPTGWALSRPVARYTLDADGYLTQLTSLTAYYEPVLSGKSAQIEVVTGVNFATQTVQTATLVFAGGLYIAP